MTRNRMLDGSGREIGPVSAAGSLTMPAHWFPRTILDQFMNPQGRIPALAIVLPQVLITSGISLSQEFEGPIELAFDYITYEIQIKETE